MWNLNNNTPFAAERTWVRDQDGAEVWIVATKGSFVIRSNGQQILAAEQTEISRVPEFSGQPGLSSLLCESDLVHKKTRTDVILHGHAYCPGGKPMNRVDVRLKINNLIDKTLRVYGNRLWERRLFGIALTRPKPFTCMPITYERAFGGKDQEAKSPRRHRWESRNPVGTGFAARKENIIGKPAPNIENLHKSYGSWRKGEPAGFGPIPRHWSPRVELAGTYDELWEKNRSPLLPLDFDERFYQCAPDDQQVPAFLKGGEVVELFNLTPDGYLRFHLPKVTLGMVTRFYDGTKTEHRADLHTLIIQPDERRFQIVWHSNLPCHNKSEQLERTNIFLKRRIKALRANLETGMWNGE
jgi:hypothetical protein